LRELWTSGGHNSSHKAFQWAKNGSDARSSPRAVGYDDEQRKDGSVLGSHEDEDIELYRHIHVTAANANPVQRKSLTRSSFFDSLTSVADTPVGSLSPASTWGNVGPYSEYESGQMIALGGFSNDFYVSPMHRLKGPLPFMC
jgi:hypothetical protein